MRSVCIQYIMSLFPSFFTFFQHILLGDVKDEVLEQLKLVGGESADEKQMAALAKRKLVVKKKVTYFEVSKVLTTTTSCLLFATNIILFGMCVQT
jgi:hypothetical protein